MRPSSGKTVVLIVEDEPGVRLIASEALRDAGYDVVEAACSDTAVDILTSRSDIAIVFTDVEIPGAFSGFELAAAIHENWPATRVIVTSGITIPEGRELPKAVTFLAKPYTPASLVGRIDALQ